MKSLLVICGMLFALGSKQGPSGSISGTLRSPDGAPQAGMRVAAMVVPGVPEAGASSLVSITLTDERGRYVLENVPSGRYYIISGNVASPTYYPDSLTPSAASIVTVSSATALAGYDFVMRPAPTAATQGAGFPPPFALMKIFSGRLVSEDGSPLPDFKATTVRLPGSSSPVHQNAFRIWALDGEYRIWIAGFPPGYALKSVSFGNTNVGLGPIKIDAASQGEIVLTLSVSAVQGVKVNGKVRNMAPEWTVPGQFVQLVSIANGGPTVETPLSADKSFEFTNVPAGEYRVSFGGEVGLRSVVLPNVKVAGINVSDVMIDFGNNPFPEYPGASLLPIFDLESLLTLRGIVTQAVTPMGRAPAKYFRMDVKDETTGAITPWAVMINSGMSATDLTDVLKLTVGSPVVVSGAGSRDGAHRLSINGATLGRVNGQSVPRN